MHTLENEKTINPWASTVCNTVKTELQSQQKESRRKEIIKIRVAINGLETSSNTEKSTKLKASALKRVIKQSLVRNDQKQEE